MSDNNVSGTAALPAWRERKNLLLAGAVGIAVLLLGGYFLLSGGSSEEELPPIPSAASAANAGGAAPTASASPSASAARTVPAVYEEDVYGNPFEAIYPAKATAVATDAAVPVTTVDLTSTVAPAEPADTGSGSDTGAAPETTAAAENASVKLVEVVDADTVRVLVDGSKDVSTFNIGTTFGGYFSLVSTRADEDEATFNFGDGTTFTLGEGETKKFIIN